MSGEVVGRITIVQEDRIRVVDDAGRGYLFVVRKRAAPIASLEAWRDRCIPVRVRYDGVPDAGALADRVDPLEPGLGVGPIQPPSPRPDRAR